MGDRAVQPSAVRALRAVLLPIALFVMGDRDAGANLSLLII